MKLRRIKKGKKPSRKSMRRTHRRNGMLKLKRVASLGFVLLCVMILIVYASSDYSRVQEVNIKGNKLVNTYVISDHVSVQEHKSLFLMTRVERLEQELAAMPLIKSAKVTKTLKGQVNIDVNEDRIVAYYTIGDKCYLIDGSGETILLDQNLNIGKVEAYPRMVDFTNVKLIKQFSTAYVDVPDIIKSSVSDIIYAPKPKDELRIRLVMDNGKELIIRIDEMSKSLQPSRFNYQAYMAEFDDYKIFSFEGNHIYMSK
ncbi:MAG: FtsQ-type POTRA domain-containing protein [Erysipelotrichaceae bacterium]|nr:FtsQ-type POTRA domain-containing protein [Erysipelotrichaceae bacterium]